MQTIKRQQTSLLHLLAMVLAALLLLTACKSKVERVQEQLDLGQRYLQELNYTEAILAFTQAIEIDPRQAEAYAGRADAYMGLYESGGEENLQLAQADYEEALRLDDQQVEVYLRLAALYTQQGDTEKALALLRQGYEATGDARLATEEEPEQASFEDRNGYMDFASLSADDQQALRDAVVAIQAGDRETMRALLEDISYPSLIYTRVDGYKVMAYGSSMAVNLEIRPESGRGYYYGYINVAPTTSEIYQSFACAGWQCNGAWSVEMSDRTTGENARGYESQASGQAENNRGTATSESILEWTGNDDITAETRMENGVITYAVIHGGVLGDIEVPDAVGSEIEMMVMEWEAW